MINIINLESDIYYGLLSWDNISNINVVQQRKQRLQNEMDWATIYETPRKNASGIGILVEMPTVRMSNNLSGPGPQTELLISVLVVECPPINLNPETGTGTDAESVGFLLLPFFHQWLIEGQGEIYPMDTPMAPARDIPNGCIGYRIAFKMQHSPLFITRVTQPSITIDINSNVTLTDISGLPAVDVYYTLDQSTPCAANTSAVKYVGPFSTNLGDVVRWQAWSVGYTPSAIGQATVGA